MLKAPPMISMAWNSGLHSAAVDNQRINRFAITAMKTQALKITVRLAKPVKNYKQLADN